MDYFTDTTLRLTGGSSFPTVTDNAYNQGLLDEWGVSVSFLPPASSTFRFGLFKVFCLETADPVCSGADTSKFAGDLKCVWVVGRMHAWFYLLAQVTSP